METLLEYCLDYGLSAFCVGALLYVIKLFVKVLNNHINDNTKAQQKLSDSITELIVYLKNK